MTTIVGTSGQSNTHPGRIRESNAAAVLAAIRRRGPLSRAAIARQTSLSMPTVSRQVAALTELGLLHELPTMVHTGAVGRPRIPVDIDNDVFAVCGVHIGVTTTTYGLTDLRGGLLGSEEMPTPTGGAPEALAAIAGKVLAFLRRWPRRNIVGLGLATGGRVDPDSGRLEHERLGWYDVPAAAIVERATGLPVHLDGHVPAMANAELLFGPGPRPGSLLYFYAREVVGVALAVDGRLHRGPGGTGNIAHLAVGGDVACPCGATGCLEVTVAEHTAVEAGMRTGVISEPDIRLLRGAAQRGEPRAVRILSDRARTLGRAVAILRDIVNPDHVVLGGQAITDAPEYLADLLDGFAGTTTLPGTDLVTVTHFGPDVQAMAACTGLLTRLFEQPFSVFDRAAGKKTS